MKKLFRNFAIGFIASVILVLLLALLTFPLFLGVFFNPFWCFLLFISVPLFWAILITPFKIK
jgi:hypothetical protein